MKIRHGLGLSIWKSSGTLKFNKSWFSREDWSKPSSNCRMEKNSNLKAVVSY